jgi:hypothetical protein
VWRIGRSATVPSNYSLMNLMYSASEVSLLAASKGLMSSVATSKLIRSIDCRFEDNVGNVFFGSQSAASQLV